MQSSVVVGVVCLAVLIGEGAAYWNDEWTNVLGRNTVVMVAVQPDSDYYKGNIKDIVQFHVDVARAVIGRDNVVILGRRDALDIYARHLPDDILMPWNVDDIWVRDFGPAVMHRQVLFKYRNQFNTEEDSTWIQGQLKRFLRRCRLYRHLGATSELANDGGNVVDNGVDTAILTSRILQDNPRWTRQQVLSELRSKTGLANIYIVPQIPEDTTGHADGMVSFIDDNVLVVATVEGDPAPSYDIDPKIKQVPAEQLLTEESWNNFTTACGWHVNLLATDNYLYIPTYADDPKNVYWGHTKERDDRFVNLVSKNTKKSVVRVATPNGVCKLGGAVRCNTWQTAGAMADGLVRAARRGYC